MALSVKLDTEDVPSILKMLGLGGMPAAASDTGRAPSEPPPVDPSITGAPDPTTAPDAQPSSASVIPSTHDAAQPPTKLLRLQQALGAAAPAQPAPPIDPAIAGSPEDSPTQPSTPAAGPVVPRGTLGLAAQPAPNLTVPKGTLATNHPTLAKVLGLGLGFVQDAGPGVGSRTFGEGFQTAAAQPALRAQRALETQKASADIAHTQATTEQMKSQVTLPNGLTVPFALAQKLYPTLITEGGKNSRNQDNIDSKEGIAAAKNVMALRSKGLKPDPANPDGPPVPLTQDEMSDVEKAHLDLQKSQQAAASATADYKQALADGEPEKAKLAWTRARTAQQNANTSAGKLGLESKKYVADYFGKDENGNALPGATTDDDGNPIGPRMANAAKIPADRLRRGDLASNAIGNLDDIVGLIHDNPELFGSLGGRITSVREMMGSDEPAIRQVAVAVHNYALASAGVHGTRSQGAVESTENDLLNHWKDGTDAVLGGISQAKKSLNNFVTNQQLGNKAIPANGAPPKKNKAAPQATHIYNPATGTIAPIGH